MKNNAARKERLDLEEPSVGFTTRYPKLMVPLRFLCRLLVMLTASYGLNVILADALGLKGGASLTLFPSVFWLAVLSLLFLSWKGFAGGIALTAAGLIVLRLHYGQNLLYFFSSGLILLWNRFMTVIDGLGYMSLPTLEAKVPLTEDALFITLSMLSSVAFFLSARKKTRILSIAVYSLLFCVPIFVYNMPSKNLGVALLAAAVAGFCAMRLCEKNTEKNSPSGFAGAAALLMSLLLLVPLLGTREPWREIPAFSEKIEELREIVTELASGRNPFADIGFEAEGRHSDPRDATAVKREFSGKLMLSVYSDVASPLYLREWVGGDYKGNVWYVPDTELLPPSCALNGMRDNPYHVTEAFLSAYESYMKQNAEEAMGLYRGFFAVSPVATGTLMPLPVTAVSDIRDPEGYAFSAPYRFHSDYIFTSSRLSRKTAYAVDAVVPRKALTDEYRSFLEAFYYYRIYAETGIMPEFGTPAYMMAVRFGQKGLQGAVGAADKGDEYAETLYRGSVESDAIDRAVLELFESTAIRSYYHTIQEGDASSKGQNGVVTLTGEDGREVTYYLSSDAAVLYADEAAFLVATFLQERCSYTLSPRKASSKDAMEEFLFGNKEGYCVQFATAATLMLRRLGFTARYAEGYIADSFSRNLNGPYSQTYVSRVRDRNAHAWVEVWVSGYGWKVFEATPGYYSDFYFGETTPPETTPPETTVPPEGSDTEVGDTTSPDTETADTTDLSDTEPLLPPETGKTPADPTAKIDPMPVLLWGGVALIVLLATVWLILRGRRRYAERMSRIALALSGCPAEERERLAERLTVDLTDALRAYRLIPEPGERPAAFGRRADRILSFPPKAVPPSKAVAALSRRIYGGLTDGEDLKAMASVTERLVKQAGRRLDPFRYVFYRWLLCRL